MKTAGDRLLPTIVKHARHSGWNSTGGTQRKIKKASLGADWVGRAHPLTEKSIFRLKWGCFGEF